MKVGVNLLWLVPGVVGGSEEYTTGLLGALAGERPAGIDVTLFVLEPFARGYPDLVGSFDTVVLGMSGRSKPLRVLAETTWLARQSRRRGIDLMHHAGGTIPVCAPGPSVVTIHDLQPFAIPHYFSARKQTYLRWRLPASARRARLVLTLTEYTRSSIVRRLGVPPERVVIVPPGVSDGSGERPEHDPRVRYQLDGPFFLYPAITYPHKNHAMLLEAFAAVVDKHPDALLVLTGKPAQEESALAARAIDLGVSHHIRRLGRVSRADIEWLYREAVALTFPSQFEGFGMPVLEAMARRCPVLAADATALPEVVDGAGMLLSPHRPDDWSRAMTDLLTDTDRRDALREAGTARAGRYTWAAAVAALTNAYTRATVEARR